MKRLLESIMRGFTLLLIMGAMGFCFIVWSLNPILWVFPPLRRKLRNAACWVIEFVFCGGGREW